MVMAFNPDDPHDGHAADEHGFTYRMLHVGSGLVTGTLEDAAERRAEAPLFIQPVVADPVLAHALRDLHAALIGDTTSLRREELFTSAVLDVVRRGAIHRPRPPAPVTAPDAARLADRARRLIDDTVLSDVTADDLAAVAGRSRFAVYRAFRTVYGMAPSD
jgi:hypothetical protein